LLLCDIDDKEKHQSLFKALNIQGNLDDPKEYIQILAAYEESKG